MAAKQLLFDEAARQAILRGVQKLSKAVVATLGPKGRNVVIDKKYGSPTVTKDGVTVAKEIELEDAYENMGAQMVREVASKTSDTAGDGTTTATVLAEAIYREGLKYRHRRRQPHRHSARHQQGRRSRRRPARQDHQEGQGQGGNQAGRHRFRQLGLPHRRHNRRRDGQGRQGRHHHGRGGEVHRDDARSGRRHAIRQGLSLALLRHQRRDDGSEARGRLHPQLRKENQQPEGPAAVARKGRAARASRCSSSPRKSKAKRSPPSW